MFKKLLKGILSLGLLTTIALPTAVYADDGSNLEDYDGNYVVANEDVLNEIDVEKVQDERKQYTLFDGSFYVPQELVPNTSSVMWNDYIRKSIENLVKDGWTILDEDAIYETGVFTGNIQKPSAASLFEGMVENWDEYKELLDEDLIGFRESVPAIKEVGEKIFGWFKDNEGELQDTMNEFTDTFKDGFEVTSIPEKYVGEWLSEDGNNTLNITSEKILFNDVECEIYAFISSKELTIINDEKKYSISLTSDNVITMRDEINTKTIFNRQ